MKTKTITIRISEPLLKQINHLSKEYSLNTSEFIRSILEFQMKGLAEIVNATKPEKR